MFYVWAFLSQDRYQYDSLILSKHTWAYPRQHFQQLLWCVVSVRLKLPEVEERKLCPLRYYANCVSTTLKVLILHNVESVCFFCSNLALLFTSSLAALWHAVFMCLSHCMKRQTICLLPQNVFQALQAIIHAQCFLFVFCVVLRIVFCVVLCIVCLVLFYVLFFVLLNVYCTTATGWLPNCS